MICRRRFHSSIYISKIDFSFRCKNWYDNTTFDGLGRVAIVDKMYHSLSFNIYDKVDNNQKHHYAYKQTLWI